MRMNVVTAAVVFSVACLTACAPGLPNRLALPDVATPEAHRIAALSGDDVRVRLDPFFDARTDMSICEIDGRKIPGDGNAGAIVSDSMRRSLEEAGVRVNGPRGTVLNGEVTAWKAVVIPGFPLSRVRADAGLKLTAFSPLGGKLYTATYRGSEEGQSPNLDEDDVKKFLEKAMNHAIVEAVNDSLLMSALAQH